MKGSALKHYRMSSLLPFFWNGSASMEWPACFQAPKMISRSFCMFRVFPVRPGAGRGTFIEKGSVRFMNSSPRS